MKIKELELTNFRSFEHCVVQFDDYYSAISGKNNAGKSNIIRALKILFGYNEYFDPFLESGESVSFEFDYPKWLHNKDQGEKRIMTIRANLSLSAVRDETLFKVVKTFYEEQVGDLDSLSLDISLLFEFRKPVKKILKVNGVLVKEDFKNANICDQLRSSKNFYFHNSTLQYPSYLEARKWVVFTETKEDLVTIEKAGQKYASTLRNVAKRNKEEISNLLGRLKTKYAVDVNIAVPDPGMLPFSLSLGDKVCSTPITEWGSGTQNQTYILLTLLRAKQIGQNPRKSGMHTPIIVVEEPESFLHPSAQAEFGVLLMDLAHEFGIQIITTTHSVYMLNNKTPQANILLERDSPRGNLRSSKVIPMDDDNWMRPFAQVLGLSNDSFSPWRELLSSDASTLILVEGDTDKAYLEFFAKDVHGTNKLCFSGEIFAYGGTGLFDNIVFLQFLIKHFKQVLITFDFDSKNKVVPKLEKLNLKENKDFIAIGKDIDGRRAIEGLLPSWVTAEVCAENPAVADQAMSNDGTKRDAQQKMKRLKLEKFIAKVKPNSEDCKDFYRLVSSINKMLKLKQQ